MKIDKIERVNKALNVLGSVEGFPFSWDTARNIAILDKYLERANKLRETLEDLHVEKDKEGKKVQYVCENGNVKKDKSGNEIKYTGQSLEKGEYFGGKYKNAANFQEDLKKLAQKDFDVESRLLKMTKEKVETLKKFCEESKKVESWILAELHGIIFEDEDFKKTPSDKDLDKEFVLEDILEEKTSDAKKDKMVKKS